MGGKAGFTKNISATGMFIEIDSDCEVGSPVEFQLQVETPGGALTLVCKGEIARLVNNNGKTGFGIKILEQSFV